MFYGLSHCCNTSKGVVGSWSHSAPNPDGPTSSSALSRSPSRPSAPCRPSADHRDRPDHPPTVSTKPMVPRDRPGENDELVPTVPWHHIDETSELVPTIPRDHADGPDRPPTIGTVSMVPGTIPMRSVRGPALVPMVPTWSRQGACGADAVPTEPIYKPHADGPRRCRTASTAGNRFTASRS